MPFRDLPLPQAPLLKERSEKSKAKFRYPFVPTEAANRWMLDCLNGDWRNGDSAAAHYFCSKLPGYDYQQAITRIGNEKAKVKRLAEENRLRAEAAAAATSPISGAAVPAASGAAAALVSSLMVAPAAPPTAPLPHSTSSFPPPAPPRDPTPSSSSSTSMADLPEVPDIAVFERVKDKCEIVFSEFNEPVLRKLEALYHKETSRDGSLDEKMIAAYAGALRIDAERCKAWFEFRVQISERVSPERSQPPPSRGSTVVKREGSYDSTHRRRQSTSNGIFPSGSDHTNRSLSPAQLHWRASPSTTTTHSPEAHIIEHPLSLHSTPEAVAGPSSLTGAQPSPQHASTSIVTSQYQYPLPTQGPPKPPFLGHARRLSGASQRSGDPRRPFSPDRSSMQPPPDPAGPSTSASPPSYPPSAYTGVGPQRPQKSIKSSRPTSAPYPQRNSPLTVTTNLSFTDPRSAQVSPSPVTPAPSISPLETLEKVKKSIDDARLSIARAEAARQRSQAPEPEDMEEGEMLVDAGEDSELDESISSLVNMAKEAMFCIDSLERRAVQPHLNY